jgi:hypothetical protein
MKTRLIILPVFLILLAGSHCCADESNEQKEQPETAWSKLFKGTLNDVLQKSNLFLNADFSNAFSEIDPNINIELKESAISNPSDANELFNNVVAKYRILTEGLSGEEAEITKKTKIYFFIEHNKKFGPAFRFEDGNSTNNIQIIRAKFNDENERIKKAVLNGRKLKEEKIEQAKNALGDIRFGDPKFSVDIKIKNMSNVTTVRGKTGEEYLIKKNTSNVTTVRRETGEEYLRETGEEYLIKIGVCFYILEPMYYNDKLYKLAIKFHGNPVPNKPIHRGSVKDEDKTIAHHTREQELEEICGSWQNLVDVLSIQYGKRPKIMLPSSALLSKIPDRREYLYFTHIWNYETKEVKIGIPYKYIGYIIDFLRIKARPFELIDDPKEIKAEYNEYNLGKDNLDVVLYITDKPTEKLVIEENKLGEKLQKQTEEKTKIESSKILK